MTVFEEVLSAARTLSAEERVRLVDTLSDDIDPADWPRPGEEWLAEIGRRSDEFDQGLSTAAPWSEVRARARKQAGLDG
jgi:putative addiction module component (TIGR02574 family)